MYVIRIPNCSAPGRFRKPWCDPGWRAVWWVFFLGYLIQMENVGNVGGGAPKFVPPLYRSYVSVVFRAYGGIFRERETAIKYSPKGIHIFPLTHGYKICKLRSQNVKPNVESNSLHFRNPPYQRL